MYLPCVPPDLSESHKYLFPSFLFVASTRSQSIISSSDLCQNVTVATLMFSSQLFPQPPSFSISTSSSKMISHSISCRTSGSFPKFSTIVSYYLQISLVLVSFSQHNSSPATTSPTSLSSSLTLSKKMSLV